MDNTQFEKAAAAVGLEETNLELIAILPLIYVAWSDGEIQPEELTIIRQRAEELGVHNSTSLAILEGWLAERPDKEFFSRGLRLLSFLLAGQTEEDAKASAADLTVLCQRVAEAAGGLSGHAIRIEGHERVALQQVSARLKLGSRPEARKALSHLLDLIAKG